MNESQDKAGLVSEPRKVGYIWIVYLLLFAIAIPWYWPTGYRGPLVLGFPLWVATTLAAIFALAVWTSFVINRYWIDAGDSD